MSMPEGFWSSRPASHPVHNLPKPELTKYSLENPDFHLTKTRKDGIPAHGTKGEEKVKSDIVMNINCVANYYIMEHPYLT